MQGIIFVAPPAAGKGTQSKFIEDKYGFVHISTGDLLREETKKNTLEGLYISEKLENGELVDDDLVSNLLEKKLSNLNSRGFILDGYPRDINQAKILDNMLNNLNITRLIVINIDIDREIAKKRILGRLQCQSCNRVYNDLIKELMPRVSGICDNCNIPLIRRTDDNEETFNERFDLYLEETSSLIKYYEDKKILYKVDGTKSKDEIFKDIEKILGSENYD